MTKCVPNKLKNFGPFNCQRVRKSGVRVDCRLLASPYGIIEYDAANSVIQEYLWVNISFIGVDEKVNGILFEYAERVKIFVLNDVNHFISGCKVLVKNVGKDNVQFLTNQTLPQMLSKRNETYLATGSAIAVYDTNKITKRHLRPVPRQFHISEDYVVGKLLDWEMLLIGLIMIDIIEKDASGFQYVSYQRVMNIYALVRNGTNAREFTIEYQDGTSRTYTCPVRDTLLATLLDVSHAAGITLTSSSLAPSFCLDKCSLYHLRSSI